MNSAEAPVYLLIDTSGSTARGPFLDAVNSALPDILGAVERREPGRRVCVVSYGTRAEVRVPLAPADQVALLPLLRADGLSSLAAGLRLLARTAADDAAQLGADGVALADPTVLVIADGLPTDPDEQVLRARAELDGAGPVTVHLLIGPEVAALPLVGLRVGVHRVAGAAPAQLAGAILHVVNGLLDGVPAA